MICLPLEYFHWNFLNFYFNRVPHPIIANHISDEGLISRKYKELKLGRSVVKNLPASAGDAGSISGSGRSPGEGTGIPLQYSCLENPLDRGAWQATVYGVAKSQTGLKRLSMHTCTQAL